MQLINNGNGSVVEIHGDAETRFKLPDGKTEVKIDHETYVVQRQNQKLACWITEHSRDTRISPAMVDEDRAVRGVVLELQSCTPLQIDFEAAWIAIYALWLHPQHRFDEVIPISVHDDNIRRFLRYTGLAVRSPFEGNDETILWLQHEAFWQGAGAPDRQHWLRARPEVEFPGFQAQIGAFPNQMAFTRKGNVCTVHPLRPPKPEPGRVIYSRFIVELGQLLEIVHIDIDNPRHFSSYTRWQNSDRVNHGWKERGDDSHHRAYLQGQLADPHSMSCLFLWDGEPAGYCELGWAKEDNAACFINSNCNIVLGEHDQNSHVLVGEEKYRGGKRYQAVATSIKHTCFLRDPRTKQVIAEPRIDLPSVPIQDRFLPQEKKKRFHLPHKDAMLFCLQRDRFFQEAHFV